MIKSLENENLKNIYSLEFKRSKSSTTIDDKNNKYFENPNKQNPFYKPYDVLVILYNELNQKYQQSKIENNELKIQFDEIKKMLEIQSLFQGSEDVTKNKLTDSIGDDIHTDENTSSKVQMQAEISDVNLVSPYDTKKVQTDAKRSCPTKLGRVLTLLYEQCNTAMTDTRMLASNIKTLAAHLFHMENCSFIMEDILKQNQYEIQQLQKELAEKNLLIDQFKLCGLDTNCKSTKSEASNLDVSNTGPDSIQVLNHNFIMEKIKCEELSKEISLLHQHLNVLKSTLNSKDKELTKIKDNEKIKCEELMKEIGLLHQHLNVLKSTLNSKDKELTIVKHNKEILELQSNIYYDDFMQERKDRENAQSKISEMEQDKDNLLNQIQNLKKLLEKCSNENTILKEEINEIGTINPLNSKLRQDNQSMKNQLKFTNQPNQIASQMQQNYANWQCPACTCINLSTQNACSACQALRFS